MSRLSPRLAMIAAVASVGLVALPARAETLTVYTYDSFISEWGPGPAIETAFEAQCGCDLVWVGVDDAGLLLTRLRLEGGATEADVVLGLDTALMADAQASGLVQAHDLPYPPLDLPMDWSDPVWIPVDYGYFAVIYDAQAMHEPPVSFDDLVSGLDESQIIIEDPRTSTPGLGLLLWVKTLYGEDAGEAWQDLSGRVLTVTKGWSEAYGLFLDGEAPMVLSYTTSPAYHIMVENTDRYRAAIFPEGNYMQIEVAAMTAATDQPDLARRFLDFVMTPEFQKRIPEGNWMYPVIDLGEDLPEAFRDLEKPKALLLAPSEVSMQRKGWIDEWLDAMSQ
jgi:thiamine transport system substrate-binding protein